MWMLLLKTLFQWVNASGLFSFEMLPGLLESSTFSVGVPVVYFLCTWVALLLQVRIFWRVWFVLVTLSLGGFSEGGFCWKIGSGLF